MTKTKYPTAKEKMEAGEWEHLGTYRQGLGGIHYYANRRDDGKYNLTYMYCSSRMGYIVFGLLKKLITPFKWLFDLINKGLGRAVFGELVDEIDEMNRAFKHNDSIGNAFSTRQGKGVSLSECLILMEKDIKNLKKEKDD